MQTIIKTAYADDIKFYLVDIDVVYEVAPGTIKDTYLPHISIKKLLTVIIIRTRDRNTEALINEDDNVEHTTVTSLTRYKIAILQLNLGIHEFYTLIL